MASVKKAWIRKYGEEEGLRKWNLHKKSLGHSEENYIKKYGKEIGIQKHEEWKYRQKGKGSLDFFIKKYGKIEGTCKYKNKNEKLSISTKALEKNGYNPKEIIEIQQKHSKNCLNNLQDYIKKYGKEEGTNRYNLMCERKRISSKRSLAYWLIYHDNDLNKAKASLKKYQSRNKETFIQKYGKIDGPKKYKEYVITKTRNWKNEGYNDSKGQKEVEDFIRTITTKKVYGIKEHYGIFLTDIEQSLLNQKIIYPDILIENDIIIEYFGNFWHASPDMFPILSKKHPYINLTIEEIRQKDLLKKQILEKRNYRYFVIWENDWNNNKSNIKKQLKEIII